MLYDNISIETLIDSEASHELLKQVNRLASSEKLKTLGVRLEEKGRLFEQTFAESAIDRMTETDLRRVLLSVFSVRKKSLFFVQANGFEPLKAEIKTLLYGNKPVAERHDWFLDAVKGINEMRALNLAGELLHFTMPDKYWLWTTWIWSPKNGKGALPLVLSDKAELAGATYGESYLKVGQAVAELTRDGHTSGYARFGKGLYGTDVFLACVYAVYMNLVFKVKLSQEYNRILPELSELAERVLGVQGKETN
ncbi:conserved hypothetical protein [Chloroherpeton thalassium ATCC 35110]|uniref:Uncharacterized protein n=1 Tax=Chloroherpeton thalassium (strain ATCC 35110 / GB-78) TaxID=517418 RepID=B3QSW2_CHLT3|nr:hypothetical protein [Chloroherpeton thalassium]ACF12605.1 conserved hypothetical protein [Chloroherpeton thalassium ATCC 35110]